MPIRTSPDLIRSGIRVLVLLICVLVGLFCGPVPQLERARSGDMERRPPAFSEPYSYTDGIEARIVDVWIGRRLGMTVIELTVTICNHTTHTFEARFTGDLRYGPYRLPAMRFLKPPGADDSGSVQLIAIGESSDAYQLSSYPHRTAMTT